MPNAWTRVPDRPPPPPPAWMAPVLPIADVFMVAMLSRPHSGSLRRTWVTPATLVLCGGAVAATAALAVLSAVSLAAGGWPVALALVASLAFLVGSAAVALVGVAQRR